MSPRPRKLLPVDVSPNASLAEKRLAALRWYLQGADLATVAAGLGFTGQRVRGWARRGGWEALRAAFWGSPRGAARVLRITYRVRLADFCRVKPPNPGQVDEGLAVLAALDGLARRGGDWRRQLLEVAERLADFVASGAHPPEMKAWLADMLQQFLESQV